VLCHSIKSIVENLIFLCRAILDSCGPLERRWQVCRKRGKKVRVTGRGSFGLAVSPSKAKPAVALPVALGAAAPVTDPMPLTDQDVGISSRDRNLTRPRTSLAFRACICMSIMNPVRYLLRRTYRRHHRSSTALLRDWLDKLGRRSCLRTGRNPCHRSSKSDPRAGTQYMGRGSALSLV
jgi:hypothetical protein